MKKLSPPKGLQLVVPVAAVVFFFILSGCGSSEEKPQSDTPPASMIEEPKADDGQGIGKFKNVELAELDAKVAESGKTVFEAKCSACHNLTEVKKVGPGLAGVTSRRQPAWILNMITNPQEMTQKDPEARKLLEEHLTQMTFQDVSDEQAKQLLEFFRQNDAGGTEQAKK